MELNQHSLGLRLREARERLGLTQADAAAAIGAPRTAVVQVEAGKRSVSTLELAELARLYHVPVADFFRVESEAGASPLTAIGRVAPEFANCPEGQQQIDRFIDICRAGMQLQLLLDGKHCLGPPAYELPAPRSNAEANEQGEAIATQERRRLELGDSPVAHIDELISSHGIWACEAPMPSEMSGLFLHAASFGMMIVVNVVHYDRRKRFSYAHEYGHALMDRGKAFNVTSATNANDRAERRANAFAAAFLMPKGGVESVLKALDKAAASRHSHVTYDVATDQPAEAESRPPPGSQEITFKDVAVVAHRFRVSYQAASYRLKDLGLLNRQELDKLLAQEEPFGKSLLQLLGQLDESQKAERTRPDKELIGQIVPLIVEAYRQEKISRGRVLDLGRELGLPGRKLLELAEAA